MLGLLELSNESKMLGSDLSPFNGTRNEKNQILSDFLIKHFPCIIIPNMSNNHGNDCGGLRIGVSSDTL